MNKPMGSTVTIKSTFLEAGNNLPPFHREVLDYWQNLRGDRTVPALSQVDLAALNPETVRFMNITDITPAPLASVYRFWGSGLTEAFGADYTGRSPIEVPPKAIGLSARGGCGRLTYEMAPHCEVKQFETLAGYRGRAVVLRLPCSNDGITVANGLGVFKFEHVNPDAGLTAFFDEVFGPLDATSSITG
ncbi:MAG: hypothetical protein CMM77_05695 [Rhodospirillaceae bacterium]|jgi:hypothetical protein|nr:hypothetical protein [Rhodospirillaceae bacterium]